MAGLSVSYVLGLPSAGSWDFYSTTKALSLCVSQARLALQRGAQAVIFDITDDPGAAQEVSVCVALVIIDLGSHSFCQLITLFF